MREAEDGTTAYTMSRQLRPTVSACFLARAAGQPTRIRNLGGHGRVVVTEVAYYTCHFAVKLWGPRDSVQARMLR